MEFAQSRGNTDGEAQNPSDLHGRSEVPRERFAARILEQEKGPTSFSRELQRPSRPGRLQIIPQFVFVGDVIEDSGLRAFRSGARAQNRTPGAVSPEPPSSVKDALAILPQNLQIGPEWRVVQFVRLRAALRVRCAAVNPLFGQY
jgi:hypothetical protein